MLPHPLQRLPSRDDAPSGLFNMILRRCDLRPFRFCIPPFRHDSVPHRPDIQPFRRDTLPHRLHPKSAIERAGANGATGDVAVRLRLGPPWLQPGTTAPLVDAGG